MHRRRAQNPHKVVIDSSLFSTESILANSFFGSIGFVNSKNDQKNSVL